MRFPTAVLLTILAFYYCLVPVVHADRPPPPSSAPPLTPPQRRQQVAAQAGVIVTAGAVYSGVVLKRANAMDLKTKLVVVVAASILSVVLLEPVGHWAANLDFEKPLPGLPGDQQQHHTLYDKEQAKKVPAPTRPAQQTHSPPVRQSPTPNKGSNSSPDHADIWVKDREPVPRKEPPTKSIQEQVFFWRKNKPSFVPERKPAAPAWSDANRKKQKYNEDYGI